MGLPFFAAVHFFLVFLLTFSPFSFLKGFFFLLPLFVVVTCKFVVTCCNLIIYYCNLYCDFSSTHLLF